MLVVDQSPAGERRYKRQLSRDLNGAVPAGNTRSQQTVQRPDLSPSLFDPPYAPQCPLLACTSRSRIIDSRLAVVLATARIP